MCTNNFDEKNIILNLTAEQRQYIYNEEKQRIEKNLTFFKKYRLYIVSYIAGCFIIYFGIINSLVDLFSKGKLIYKPESNYFETLFNSAIELIRPFLATIMLYWPLLLIYGFWLWCDEIFRKYLKKYFRSN